MAHGQHQGTQFHRNLGEIYMSAISDAQVKTELGSIGIPLDNFFTIPGESEDRGLIAFWYPEIGVRYLILEDNAVAQACYRYLQMRGVRRFLSGDDIVQSSNSEKWPGWDTCSDAIRDRRIGIDARVGTEK
jgi:hypothetical protein